MMHEYKRKQMEFEDHEWQHYNHAPIAFSAPFQYYFDRQCEYGLRRLHHADLGNPESVLICGVGGGADLEYWLQHLPMKSCFAIDFSYEAIRATQRRVRNHRLPSITQYVKADIESIPLRDRSVDLVIATQVLHHTLDPAQACKEMFRVAKRGVLLLEPAHTAMVRLLSIAGIARAEESAGNVVLRFRQSDFTLYLKGLTCSIKYHTYFFYDHPRIQQILGKYFDSNVGLRLLKALYWTADRLALPLHSKCAVVLVK